MHRMIFPSVRRSSPVLPWVSLGPTLATEAAPAGARKPRDVCVWVDRNCGQLCHGSTVITEPALPHSVPQHSGDVWTAPPEEDSNQSCMGNSNRGLRLHQLLNSHITFTYPTFYCICNLHTWYMFSSGILYIFPQCILMTICGGFWWV